MWCELHHLVHQTHGLLSLLTINVYESVHCGETDWFHTHYQDHQITAFIYYFNYVTLNKMSWSPVTNLPRLVSPSEIHPLTRFIVLVNLSFKHHLSWSCSGGKWDLFPSLPFPCNGCWKHTLTYLCDPLGVQTKPCHYVETGSTAEINDAAITLISSLKGFLSTWTVKQLSHHHWMYLGAVWMWHFR